MRLVLGIALWLSFFVVSCREDITFETPNSALRFSQDTLILDTVYHQVRSETYAVKIYNDEDRDISIPKISLEKGAASLYKLNVDGQSGTTFTHIPLRKKDSLYIFVEIAPQAHATEAVEIDKILFEGAQNQHITLMSVVQDAEFFASTKDQPKTLDNTVWRNDKAKIILGNLTLNEGQILTIEAGTKVYFYKNSGLKISKNAILNINGEYKKEVILRGERNSTHYDTIPANWNGIALEEGATAHINYAKISGGNTGISLNHAKADIKNTIIHTFEDYGIFANRGQITAENLVMNHCGQANIGIVNGGDYQLLHSTLFNFASFSAAKNALGIEASNEWQDPTTGQVSHAPLSLNLKNSILYTTGNNAVSFKGNSTASIQYWIENSLLKYNATDAGFPWDNNLNITQSMKNEDPLFINHYIKKMNLRLQPNSPARGKGNLNVAQQVPLDLSGDSRLSQPNMGAYQL